MKRLLMAHIFHVHRRFIFRVLRSNLSFFSCEDYYTYFHLISSSKSPKLTENVEKKRVDHWKEVHILPFLIDWKSDFRPTIYPSPGQMNQSIRRVMGVLVYVYVCHCIRARQTLANFKFVPSGACECSLLE